VSFFSTKLLLAASLLAPQLYAATAHKAPAGRHSTPSAQKSSAKKSQAASVTRVAAKSHTGSSAHSKKTRAKKSRGQQSIDSDRVTQIQQALIREHYLSGDPSGSWDVETQTAMQRYQADHGWQTKLLPDARAIKSLGLGPDYSSAINAAGASFNAPAGGTTPAAQAQGFAQAAGIKE